MRFLILSIMFLWIPGIPLANSYPASQKLAYVNDFANVIENGTQQRLNKKLKDVEYYSGVEIAVVTIKSYGSYNTGAQSWEEFATGLFNKWGIGHVPENNGVLILVSKQDRKIRIELGSGYPSHYDSIMKSIIDESMVPQLKNNDYTGGIVLGTNRVIQAVTVPVSFFEWYGKYIVAGIAALISIMIAIYAEKTGNRNIAFVFLGIAGYLIFFIIRGLLSGNLDDGFPDDNSNDFGGGSSDGGGASGDF